MLLIRPQREARTHERGTSIGRHPCFYLAFLKLSSLNNTRTAETESLRARQRECNFSLVLFTECVLETVDSVFADPNPNRTIEISMSSRRRRIIMPSR